MTVEIIEGGSGRMYKENSKSLKINKAINLVKLMGK